MAIDLKHKKDDEKNTQGTQAWTYSNKQRHERNTNKHDEYTNNTKLKTQNKKKEKFKLGLPPKKRLFNVISSTYLLLT